MVVVRSLRKNKGVVSKLAIVDLRVEKACKEFYRGKCKTVRPPSSLSVDFGYVKIRHIINLSVGTSTSEGLPVTELKFHFVYLLTFYRVSIVHFGEIFILYNYMAFSLHKKLKLVTNRKEQEGD